MIVKNKHALILRWLARYKYLCLSQLHQNFFRSTTLRNTEIALKRLEEKGLIHRLKFPRSPHFNFGCVCYLSKQGYELVSQEEHFEQQKFIHQPVTKPIESVNHFYHRKRGTDFRIALDLKIQQLPTISLKSLLTESRQITAKGSKMVETNFTEGDVSVIADIAFVIRNDAGKEAVFMVEIDTGKETIGGAFDKIPNGSLLSKYKNYEALLKSEVWKDRLDTNERAFRVLTITEETKHAHTIARRIRNNLRLPQLFLISTHDKIEPRKIFDGDIWLNASTGKNEKLLSKG